LVAALIGLEADLVVEICREASAHGVVTAANFNCPGQVVIAGEKAAVERAIEAAKAKGCRKAIPLPVSVPVHTPLMQGAAERLGKEFDRVPWKDPKLPVINNAEAVALRTAEAIRASLVRQLPSSVQWEKSIKVMADLGVDTCVEVGPGSVLTGLVKRIVPKIRTLNVSDPVSLDASVAQLRSAAGT
jgi:[acyl-carrier-protein] S-malonyltransferase